MEKRQAGFIKWYVRRVTARAHYVIITLVCAFLSTYKIILSQNALYKSVISLLFTWGLTIAVITFMVIKVTDERLLQKTGGIIQGMSGAPIIQNGKFIGAVTHVFVSAAEEEARKRDANRNPQ